MKLSFCTMGYIEYTTMEEAVRRIASHGYDGVDFWGYSPHLDPFMTDSGDRKRIRQLVDNHHVEVSGLSAAGGTLALHLNISHSSAQVRLAATEYYKALVGLAADVGSPVINVISGHKVYGASLEDAWKWNREAIEGILREAERKKVTVALHTLTPCESEVLVTLDDSLRMIREIGSEKLKLIVDTADQNVTDPNLYSAVLKAKERLAYVHVNDNFGEKRGDVHLPPGRGNINWGLFLRALKEIKYDGFLLVQSHNLGGPIDIDAWAVEAIEYMRRLM